MIETGRSKQLWAICYRFGLLPSDPRLQDLTPFQCVWIIANMNEEVAQQHKAMTGEDSYNINTSNFDEGTFATLAALAQHGSDNKS